MVPRFSLSSLSIALNVPRQYEMALITTNVAGGMRARYQV
jgi:hypothetical protein